MAVHFTVGATLRQVHVVPVVMPYRLDLTVSVLRRMSTNVVDLLTPEGQYVRVLSGYPHPVIVRVTQIRHENSLTVTIDGDASSVASSRVDSGDGVLDTVCSMLGVTRDLEPFDRAAADIPWLAPLVKRMRGVKPPRYPTLWEACANAIVFQQVSLRAASAIMHRILVTLGEPVMTDEVRLFVFPTMENVRDADDDLLRAAGLSASKVATLQRVVAAIGSGALDASALEASTSQDAAVVLQKIKGIGPWTAAVILLRGLGRLDVFPSNDTSVASNMALVAGPEPPDTQRVLDALGAQRGMLYFYLLLARLECRGEIGRASFENSNSHWSAVSLPRRRNC